MECGNCNSEIKREQVMVTVPAIECAWPECEKAGACLKPHDHGEKYHYDCWR